MSHNRFIAALSGLMLLLHANAFPAEQEEPSEGAPVAEAAGVPELPSRATRGFGLYVSMLGDPYPAGFGFNLAYHATSFLRVFAGYSPGWTSEVETTTVTYPSNYYMPSTTRTIPGSKMDSDIFGGGVRAFIPGWNFSPFLGVGYSYVKIEATQPIWKLDYMGFTESGGHVYASVGLDWQARTGFHAAIGYQRSLRAGIESAPFLELGWFIGRF